MTGGADDKGRLPRRPGLDSTGVGHGHHLLVAGPVGGLPGQVAGSTVGKMGGDQNLVGARGIEHAFLRKQGHPFDLNLRILALVRSAGLNPVQQSAVVGRLGGQAFSTSMRQKERGLAQQQAVFGLAQVDARRLRTRGFQAHDLVGAALDDPAVVFLRIQGVERELESPSSLDTRMATAVVASPLGQDAADIVLKTEGWRRLQRMHRQSCRG